jgi:deoxyribodipyrimidine photolyase
MPIDVASASVVLGLDYPQSIVEHDEARKRALAAYEKIR